MANLQMNPNTALALFSMLSQNAAGGAGQATPATATGAAQPSTSGTATITPEQQAILAGANSPSLAPQRAAAQEQRIIESQNPQAQQPVQNAPNGTQPQQSDLGNFSQEQAQQGQQGAQTASEKSLWDTIAGGMSGEGLTGEALADWRKNRALGAALGMMGSAIGGDTTGGRLAEGTYQLGAGSLAAKNAELREDAQNNFMQAAASALGIKPTTTQGGAQAQTQGSTMTQNKPSQQTLPNGESSLNGDMQGLINDLDVQLERLRRLGQTI